MSLEEPLLTSVDVQDPPAQAPRSSIRPSKTRKESMKPKPATQFENLIEERENQNIWEFFMKERQNIKEIEVLDLLISRLSHHTAAMGAFQSEYKVIARLRDVGVELQEFSKRLEGIPVLKMFIDDLESVKGFGPLPSLRNMKNFLKAVSKAFDGGIKIAELDENEDLDGVDPEADPDAEEGEDSEEGSGDRGSGDKDSSNESSSSAGGDEEDEEDESKIKPADLLVKYSPKQLRNQLRQLGVDVSVGTQKETAEELAKRLADVLNQRQIETVSAFAERWWEWKGKKKLKDAEVAVVQKLCDDVADCMSNRLECATTRFDDFPICSWFDMLLLESMSGLGHFGFLNFEFEMDDDACTTYLPEGMAWTQLGVLTTDMIRLGWMEEAGTANCTRDFGLGIADIHSRMLPAFILKLTRLKAIMASQVVTTDQMRNKILAGVVTGAMAAMSVGMHIAAVRLGMTNGGGGPAC